MQAGNPLHLICVGNDGIDKFQSKVKSAAELLKQCGNCMSSWDLQPDLRAIRQNNMTHLLSRVNIHILQQDIGMLTMDTSTRVMIIFLLICYRYCHFLFNLPVLGHHHRVVQVLGGTYCICRVRSCILPTLKPNVTKHVKSLTFLRYLQQNLLFILFFFKCLSHK